MLIAARNAMLTGKRLPYDAEVEYLESTRTQYIDTGVIATSQTTISLRSYNSPQTANSQIIAGVFDNTSGTAIRSMLLVNADTRHYYYFGTSTSINWFAVPFGQWVSFDLGSSIEWNAGSGSGTYTPPSSGAFSTSTSIALFARHVNNNGTKYFDAFWNGRISSCSISDNGVLVRDFTPVRFTNEQGVSEGAMFDRVSGELFGNAGTGAFVIGPDK